MDLTLQGLRVLVTAGASGIGLATARAFAREGAHVHVCDIDGAALASLATSDPGISRSACDVADATSVARLFPETQPALAGLHPLVNNAGIAAPTPARQALPFRDWARTRPLT